MSEWNAKVKCVDAPELSNYTPSKIYNVKDSHITSDTGRESFTKYDSLQDLNDTLYAQFELVEEPTRYTQLAAYKLILEDLSREFECKYEGKKYTLEYCKTSNSICKLSKNGFIASSEYWLDSEWTEVEKQWMPKCMEKYWVVDFSKEESVYSYTWYNDEVDVCHANSCGVYKTKEEAVEVAKKMLKALEV